MEEEKREEEKPGTVDVGGPSLKTGLSQKEMSDSMELSRKKASAALPLDVLAAQLKRDAAQYAPESEEDRKRRERREKSGRLISVISDGLASLGNLYFTSRYAPHMYDGSNSMTAATDARIERLKAERQANADRYLNYSLKIGDLQNQKARTLREIEAQHEAQKIAREKAQQAAERHEWEKKLQPDKQREQAGKATKAENDAVAAQYAAEYAPQMQEAKLNTEKERANAQRASAANSYASAAAHGRSEQKEFSAWDENGKEHKFRTQAAAESFAKQHGTWVEVDDVTVTDMNSELNGKSSKTVTKKKGYSQKPSKGTMPGVRSNDRNKMPGVK